MCMLCWILSRQHEYKKRRTVHQRNAQTLKRCIHATLNPDHATLFAIFMLANLVSCDEGSESFIQIHSDGIVFRCVVCLPGLYVKVVSSPYMRCQEENETVMEDHESQVAETSA